MGKEEKTSKPLTIAWKRQWDGPNGMIHYFDIEFEDGTTGEFSTKLKDQKKFTIGKEVNYSVEETSNARGPFTKIDIPKPKPGEPGSGGTGGGKNPGGGRGLSPEVEASITMSVCLDCAAICILKTGKVDKVTEDLVPLHAIANKFFKHITEKSAGNRQLSINYQSRLKEVVGILMDFKNEKGDSILNIKSSEDILKYVDLEVAYLQLKMNEAK